MNINTAQIHARNMRIYRKRQTLKVEVTIPKISLKGTFPTKKQRKTMRKFNTYGYIFLSAVMFMWVYTKFSYDFISNLKAEAAAPLLWPIPTPTPKPVIVEKLVKEQDIDTWVRDYVNQYFKTDSERSEMKMVMHCLLSRESLHGVNKGHGDGGLAGGPLQFHEETWQRMRGQMLKDKLITDIGSRYDTKEAIHTTVWAIKNGRGREWGPLYRTSLGNNKHACPLPSGY